jgi:hypothetical protein
MVAIPFLVALFGGIVAAYYFLVKGLLFKGILLVGGSVAIWMVLSGYKEFQGEAFRLGGAVFAWSSALPIALVILVLLTTKAKD